MDGHQHKRLQFPEKIQFVSIKFSYLTILVTVKNDKQINKIGTQNSIELIKNPIIFGETKKTYQGTLKNFKFHWHKLTFQ